MHIKTTLTDKRVAGYVNHSDRPDTVYALQHHYVVSSKSEEDRQKMKQDIATMLKSIDAPEEQSVIPPLIPDVPKDLPTASKSHLNLDKDIVKSIEETILDHSPNVTWNDIKGLEEVKKILNETIVLPTLRPEIFKGLLSPSKGILLYGLYADIWLNDFM